MVQNKIIHIFGGAGSIGSELTRQLSDKNSVVVFDIDETRMFDLVEELRLEGKDVDGYVVDIRDSNVMDHTRVIHDSVDIVINAAARKHVAPMEDTPLEAVSVNIMGLHKIIERCFPWGGVKLINISTDKVVNAESIMGATKKVGELMVKNAGYTSVRFGNVMGSRGSVIPFWQKQMDQGKPLTVTDERMERYMMSIEEACSLVLQVIEMEDVAGKIVVLDMGPRKNILQLAKEILGKEQENNIRMIGIRKGEQLVEHGMTEEEQKRATRKGKFFIL